MKNTFLMVFSMLMVFPVLACEICGATNNTSGFGSLEQGNRHSIGIQYQFRNYRSEHPILFSQLTEKSTESFQRIDVKGQFKVTKRFQAQVTLPFSYNMQTKRDTTNVRTGLADPILSGVFFLVNKSDSMNKQFIRWTAGIGLKMPLGAFPEPHNDLLLLYPGTGTFDGQFQTTFLFKKNRWSALLDFQAMLRGTNKYAYQPGAMFSSTLFVQRNLEKWGVFGGTQYAWNGTDYQNRKSINSSPSLGSILSGSFGISYQSKKWLIQGNFHVPLVQQLNLGYTKQEHAFVCSLTYFL